MTLCKTAGSVFREPKFRSPHSKQPRCEPAVFLFVLRTEGQASQIVYAKVDRERHGSCERFSGSNRSDLPIWLGSGCAVLSKGAMEPLETVVERLGRAAKADANMSGQAEELARRDNYPMLTP